MRNRAGIIMWCKPKKQLLLIKRIKNGSVYYVDNLPFHIRGILLRRGGLLSQGTWIYPWLRTSYVYLRQTEQTLHKGT